MQTEKDAEIVDWIGCLGAAGAGHVMGRFYMGRSWAYARLSKLVMDGLLEQKTLLYRQPGLYIATADGLRWQGLQRLGVYKVSPGGFQHAREVANAAVSLHRVLPDWEMLSEREIRIHQNDQDELIASTKLGELPGARPAPHRPDLALISPYGSTVAVEVELSVKAPRRLAAICRAWARARHISAAYYIATPAAARALQRAITETRTEDHIIVLPIDEPEALADINELEGSSV